MRRRGWKDDTKKAIAIIKAIGKHAIESALLPPGDIVDATALAVEALVPKPDEVTGLVPCGYPFPSLAKLDDCELTESRGLNQTDEIKKALRQHGCESFIEQEEPAQ